MVVGLDENEPVISLAEAAETRWLMQQSETRNRAPKPLMHYPSGKTNSRTKFNLG